MTFLTLISGQLWWKFRVGGARVSWERDKLSLVRQRMDRVINQSLRRGLVRGHIKGVWVLSASTSS